MMRGVESSHIYRNRNILLLSIPRNPANPWQATDEPSRSRSRSQESGESEDTGKTSSGGSESAGSAGVLRRRALDRGAGRSIGGSSGISGGVDRGRSSAAVHGSGTGASGGSAAVDRSGTGAGRSSRAGDRVDRRVSVGRDGDVSGLAHGEVAGWAIGDLGSQSVYKSETLAIGETYHGGVRAVGGGLGDNDRLGGDGLVAVAGRGNASKGGSSSDGEAHFDGWYYGLVKLVDWASEVVKTW